MFADAGNSGEAFGERPFHDLEQVEAASFWFRARNRIIAWALQTYFPEAASFLEVGCGNGFVLSGLHAEFPKLALAGGELGRPGLAAARRRLPDIPLYAVDAKRLPFEEEFDVAGAFDVIEHVVEDETVLASMRRSVRSGGGVMVTVPQHAWLWSASDEYAGHRRRYTRAELAGKLERAGLSLVRATSFVSLLLPLLIVSRIAQRRRRQFDPLDEFRIPKILDRALDSVLRGELALIASGLSLPIGGSLLVVARKEG